MLRKIISGGQTGVDIAALRAANAVGLETGGWMPRGWRTEAGPRPEYRDLYGMQEATTDDYPMRTRLNVQESYITFLVGSDLDSRGSKLVRRAVSEYARWFLQFEPPKFQNRPMSYEEAQSINADYTDSLVMTFASSIAGHATGPLPRTLNVAGNRDASLEAPVEGWLTAVFREIVRRQGEQS